MCGTEIKRNKGKERKDVTHSFTELQHSELWRQDFLCCSMHDAPHNKICPVLCFTKDFFCFKLAVLQWQKQLLADVPAQTWPRLYPRNSCYSNLITHRQCWTWLILSGWMGDNPCSRSNMWWGDWNQRSTGLIPIHCFIMTHLTITRGWSVLFYAYFRLYLSIRAMFQLFIPSSLCLYSSLRARCGQDPSVPSTPIQSYRLTGEWCCAGMCRVRVPDPKHAVEERRGADSKLVCAINFSFKTPTALE